MGRGSAARRTRPRRRASGAGGRRPDRQGDDRRVGPGEEASIAENLLRIDATATADVRWAAGGRRRSGQAVGVGKLVRARGEVDGWTGRVLLRGTARSSLPTAGRGSSMRGCSPTGVKRSIAAMAKATKVDGASPAASAAWMLGTMRMPSFWRHSAR